MQIINPDQIKFLRHLLTLESHSSENRSKLISFICPRVVLCFGNIRNYSFFKFGIKKDISNYCGIATFSTIPKRFEGIIN